MKLSLTKTNQFEGDYSGLDVMDKLFNGIDLHNSVFNGGYFTRTKFINCDLRHTEFTEAKFENCIFETCNLDYSDFVFLSATETKFVNCSFTNVEWRENTFTRLNFVRCSFYNSTISLCSFIRTEFDHDSSSNFCGATKRYNVFSQSIFELLEDKIDFLTVNYGIRRAEDDATISLTPKNKKDNFLVLSISKYFNNLDTHDFVRIVTQIGEELSAKGQKNHIQRIKYLILICRITAAEDTISVFGLQLLINGLNRSARKITESIIFMEVVDLIMFLKTHQYKTMKRIEVEVSDLTGEYVDNVSCQCKLCNSYTKSDIRKFVLQIADFLALPKNQISVTSFQSGSTIFEFIIKCSVSLGGFLLFINFSLHQVHKTIEYLAKMKKNIKYLKKKKREEEAKTDQNLSIVPFAVMNNEGNIYYTQVNNIINIHGSDMIKIDGPGEIKIVAKKAKAS
jgi:hypothetical protein